LGGAEAIRPDAAIVVMVAVGHQVPTAAQAAPARDRHGADVESRRRRRAIPAAMPYRRWRRSVFRSGLQSEAGNMPTSALTHASVPFRVRSRTLLRQA